MITKIIVILLIGLWIITFGPFLFYQEPVPPADEEGENDQLTSD
jgi:hypothetical protein